MKDLEKLFKDMEHFINPYDEERFKEFVENKLKQRDKEIIREIEKAKKVFKGLDIGGKLQNYYHGEVDGFNKARNEIINIIKKR